ncbi:SWIM zinc finger family protein, partial [Salmonella sp. SAL4438]|uniref:SWIM zinc finger family protein n=1 Tax=Salmonella sp. SAL4438 TaxID=3159893 RepID=UPI00397CEB86
FPAPGEIDLDCSCPDSASMCKHIAAVLYGIGARLDHEPHLLFTLRRVDEKELVARASQGTKLGAKQPRPSKILKHAGMAELFG